MLSPYVPRLVVDWLRTTPDESWRQVEGTLAFVDISGFTKMTERLARRGKVGAEEMNDLLDACFTQLLRVAYMDGAGLVKWGGDAVLLLFQGENHAARACRAAHSMRRTLRRMGRLLSSAGFVTLRMSVGIHTGRFDFFLVGDLHRELIVAGPAPSQTVAMESTAEAGEILISAATARQIDAKLVGPPKGDGFLLKGAPTVPGEEAEPPPDVSDLDLSAFLPLGIREHVLSGSGEPEHRHVTVAFIEFQGTDDFIQESGPAALAAALDRCVRDVQEACARHGVTFFETDIAQNGGKIMLVAGAPRSSGNDETGMLNAVRRIADSTTGLRLRIGVNCGRVFAGDFGPPFRRTYSVKGDAVNLAARLMGKAQPGQILATVGVLERSRSEFETEQLEPFLVKGKKAPVHARVVGPIRGAKRLLPAELGPLFGREEEVKTLLATLESAQWGRGRLVQLVGEPGIGKSRLVEELRMRAQDFRVLSATCDQYESSTPYFPFRRLLRTILGIDDELTAGNRLTQVVKAAVPELEPWLPLLAIPFGVDVSGTIETEQLDEQFRRTRLKEAVTTVLRALLSGPTLLTFEDVHWMDEASADLLHHLAGELDALPWLICVTRRDQPAGFVPSEGDWLVSIRLEPLSADAATTMVWTAAGELALAPHEIDSLARRSAGNPLFLKELLAMARSAQSLEALPDSVEGLIASRIDLLDPSDRTLLRYASVLGNSFPEELLRSVLPADFSSTSEQVWQRLAEFLQKDDQGIFRFQHALIRDAAYEGLPYRRRRDLHLEVGMALEDAAANAEDQAELLSLHFFYAQDHERAWKYSRFAGDRAKANFALVEAADFYRRAITSGRALASVPPHELLTVYEALGEVGDRLGMYAEARRALQAARRLASGDPVTEARLSLKEAVTQEASGRYAEAIRWVRRGERALEGTDTKEADRLRAQLSVWQAVLRQSQGRHIEAVGWCDRAIELAQESGELEALARAYFVLDWAFIDLGRPDKAIYSARALAIYQELGDLVGEALVYNNLGAWRYYQGKWDEAIEFYEKGRTAREKTGDAVNAAAGTSNIGEILSDQGRLEEAEPLFREALRVWKAAGFRAGVADATIHLGRVASRSGRFEEALKLFEEARAEYVHVGAGPLVLETDARIAECSLFQGDAGAVLSLTESALRRAETLGGIGPQAAMLHRLAGYAHIQRGDLPAARASLAESLEVGRARQAEFEVALTLRALAELTRIEGGNEAAGALQAESEAILGRLHVIWMPRVPLREGDSQSSGR